MKRSKMYTRSEIKTASAPTQIEYAIETGEIMDCLMGNGCYNRKGTDAALSTCCIDTGRFIYGLNYLYEDGTIQPEDAERMFIELMQKDGAGLLVAMKYITEYFSFKTHYPEDISLSLDTERLKKVASEQYIKFEEDLSRITRIDQIGLRGNVKHELLNINGFLRSYYGFDIIGQ